MTISSRVAPRRFEASGMGGTADMVCLKSRSHARGWMQ